MVVSFYKKNMPIRLNPLNSLCNGTMMVWRGIDYNVIHAKIMMGQDASKLVFIPEFIFHLQKIKNIFLNSSNNNSILLCFALIISKAQGQIILLDCIW